MTVWKKGKQEWRPGVFGPGAPAEGWTLGDDHTGPLPGEMPRRRIHWLGRKEMQAHDNADMTRKLVCSKPSTISHSPNVMIRQQPGLHQWSCSFGCRRHKEGCSFYQWVSKGKSAERRGYRRGETGVCPTTVIMGILLTATKGLPEPH